MLTMRRIFTYLIIVIGLLASLLLTACDSFLHVEGTVYEWKNAPNDAKGQIYINQKPPQEYDLQPVQFVTLRFLTNEHGWAKPDENRKFRPLLVYGPDNHLDKEAVVRSVSYFGTFEGGWWVVGPGEYHMKIVVENANFYTIEQIFLFRGSEPGKYQFSVVLVRKK
jgi:hypothetical protein